MKSDNILQSILMELTENAKQISQEEMVRFRRDAQRFLPDICGGSRTFRLCCQSFCKSPDASWHDCILCQENPPLRPFRKETCW